MKRVIIGVIFLVVYYNSAVNAQYAIQNAFPNITISSPVDFQMPDDFTNRVFVVSQQGIIYTFPNSSQASNPKQFLNITDRVSYGGEMGLLGLAFHPDYRINGYFYVNYTVSNPRKTRISRFQVSPNNPDSAMKESELILLTFDQPYSNHKGGQVSFGPDGYLYIATGDGGSAGDPQNNGQNKASLLGKILRIDVNNVQPGLQYAIPPDNPFKNNTQGYKEEIFAWGLRNPWRFSFDTVTGLLYAADVGQGLYEEIDIIKNGKNYGWKIMEGAHCYNASSCDTTGLTLPIWEYGHNSTGGYSITGGYVYYGYNVPGLRGKYIYGDYVSKRLWGLIYNGTTVINNEVLNNAAGISLSSFGLDAEGEIYLLDLIGGKIYKFNKTNTINAPSSLVAVLQNQTSPPSAHLTWGDNSSEETGFVIERRKIQEKQFRVIDTVSANITEYFDTTITMQSYYRVRAITTTGSSGFSNTASVTFTIPVELVSFYGSINDNIVNLYWETGTETNNMGFEILKQIGDNWEKIGFVPGAGNSANSLKYSFKYELFPAEAGKTIRFRLKQIDYSGGSELSNIIEIVYSHLTEFSIGKNYPNPFNPRTSFTVNLPSFAFLRVEAVDILGNTLEVIQEGEKEAGNHTIEWNAEKFSSGLYIIRVTAKTGYGVYSGFTKALLLK